MPRAVEAVLKKNELGYFYKNFLFRVLIKIAENALIKHAHSFLCCLLKSRARYQHHGVLSCFLVIIMVSSSAKSIYTSFHEWTAVYYVVIRKYLILIFPF